jgi:benzoate membrane transport protein
MAWLQLWEPDTRIRESLRNLPRAITLSTFSAGMVAALMGISAPAVLLYEAVTRTGITPEQAGSWFFAIYAGGGLMGLILALMYRQPSAGAWSFAGLVLLIQVLPKYGFHQAIGAYYMAGAVITLLALTGLFERIMRLFPPEIVMAMLAGVMFNISLQIFPALTQEPVFVLPTVLAFLVAWRWQHRVFTPTTAAVLVGLVLVILLRPPAPGAVSLSFSLPSLYPATFTLDAFLSLSMPLVLLALSSQNATGISVLMAQGYPPKINAITLLTGLLTLLTAPMGGHGVNLSTPMAAICSAPDSHPDKELRYGAVVINGAFFILFGTMGLTVLSVIEIMPRGLILAIAGLAMLPIVLTSFQQSIGTGRRPLGCLFALIIAASNVSWLGIGAAFWSLILATLISYGLERPAAAK